MLLRTKLPADVWLVTPVDSKLSEYNWLALVDRSVERSRSMRAALVSVRMLVGMLVCIVEYRLVIAVCVSILDSSTSAKTYGRLVDLNNERAL